MIAFALIGCGHIAQRDLKAFADGQIPRGKLAAVCDIDPERAREAGERFGLPWFSDMHRMMKEMGDKIDIVSLLTDNGSHASHCVELARYGKHIMVEKPMALSVRDADDMIRACNKGGARLFVVKQSRYNRQARKLREALDQGRFGKLVMGTVRMRWSRSQEYYDQAPWRGTRAHDGGVFANQAAHLIDLLQWSLGEPVSVFAKARTALVNIEAEDTGVALITFRNQAIGVVEATTAARPKGTEGSISILGEKGLVEIGGMGANQIITWNFADKRPEDDDVFSTVPDPADAYGVGRLAFLRHVVDAVLDEKPSQADGLDGRNAVALVSAMYASIDSRQEILLDIAAAGHPLTAEANA